MNWISQQNNPKPSKFDKIKQLLKISSKLVLVQKDELENLRNVKTLHNKEIVFIDYLFNHYITLGLGKSYNY
jgi:hypothetical protein